MGSFFREGVASLSEHGVGGVSGAVDSRAEQSRLIAGLLALGALISFVAAAGLLLYNLRRPAPVNLISPASHATLETGFGLYRSHCASCHGAFLGGAPGWRDDARLAPALDETGHAFNHSDLDLFTRIAGGARAPDGRVSMPAFRSVLSDSEIVTILSYIAAWWPEQELSRRASQDWTFPAICGPAGGAGAAN